MAHINNRRGFPIVVLDDNGHMNLYTPTGHLVEGIELKVSDSVDSLCTYEISGVCNIVKDKEEMREWLES